MNFPFWAGNELFDPDGLSVLLEYRSNQLGPAAIRGVEACYQALVGRGFWPGQVWECTALIAIKRTVAGTVGKAAVWLDGGPYIEGARLIWDPRILIERPTLEQVAGAATELGQEVAL